MDQVMETSDTPPTSIEVHEALDVIARPDVRGGLQVGFFVFALLVACYVASEIILPIILAFVLMLVLQPVMRLFDKLRVPRTMAALVIILLLFGSVVGLGAALSGPAASWAEKLPGGIPRLQERLTLLSKPIQTLQKFLHQAEGLTQGAEAGVTTITVQGSGLNDKVLNTTRAIASGLFTTVLVLFFLLVSGDLFLMRLVEILPRFKDKRQAVHISQQIEADISAYLMTITIMNVAVGVATGIIAIVFGLGDPLLWGTVAFLLELRPCAWPNDRYGNLRPCWSAVNRDAVVSLCACGSLLSHSCHRGGGRDSDAACQALHDQSGVVILALVFWYWMWGIPGAILATPMLAITKIICDRIQSLTAIGHLIEG